MFTIGVFQDVQWAERGLAALVADGFDPRSLTVLSKKSPEAEALIQRHLGTSPHDLELKGLGTVTAAGTLLNALGQTQSLLESGGLAANIGRAGFQAHDGQIFEALVSRGGVLVAVESVPRAADALARLHAFGGGNAAIGAWLGRV